MDVAAALVQADQEQVKEFQKEGHSESSPRQMTRTLIWYVVLLGLTVLLHYFHVEWSKPCTFDEMKSRVGIYLRRRTALLFGAYLILGLLLTLCCLGLCSADLANSMTCSEDEGCINDKYIFILFSTMYSVGSLFIGFRKSYAYRLQFPELGRPTHGMLRHLYSIFVKESSADVLQILPLCYTSYYFLGTTFRVWLSSSEKPNLGKNLLQTLTQLFSIELFLYMFVTSVFTVGSIKICWQFLQYTLTRRKEFPLDVDPVLSESENVILLPEAMRSTTNYYIRNQGFYDLYLMTEQVENRVEDLFKIGYRGSRVTVWTMVFEECIKVIRENTELMKKVVEQEQKIKKDWLSSAGKKSGEVKLQDRSTKRQPNLSSVFETNLNSGYEYSSSPSVNSLTIRRRGFYPASPIEFSRDGQPIVRQSMTLSPVETFLRGSLRHDKAIALIRRKLRGSSWAELYFRKRLEVKISMLFSDSQVVLLSLQSLMNIVNIYLKNSIARVVQQDLALIITTLVDFHEALGFLKKIDIKFSPSTVLFKSKEDSTSIGIIHNNSALKRLDDHLTNACTNALLALNYHFNDYFEFMPISFEHQTKLKNLVKSENYLDKA